MRNLKKVSVYLYLTFTFLEMENRNRNIFYFFLFHLCFGELDFTYHDYDAGKFSIYRGSINGVQHLNVEARQIVALYNCYQSKIRKLIKVTSLFHKYETDFPDLCKVYSIGTSVQGRELWVLQITQGVNDIPKLRIRFQFEK